MHQRSIGCVFVSKLVHNSSSMSFRSGCETIIYTTCVRLGLTRDHGHDIYFIAPNLSDKRNLHSTQFVNLNKRHWNDSLSHSSAISNIYLSQFVTKSMNICFCCTEHTKFVAWVVKFTPISSNVNDSRPGSLRINDSNLFSHSNRNPHFFNDASYILVPLHHLWNEISCQKSWCVAVNDTCTK